MIAFTKQEGGQFYIGVMEIDGSNERMIAKSFHVEGPTWSPNGRYLAAACTAENDKTVIKIFDMEYME